MVNKFMKETDRSQYIKIDEDIKQKQCKGMYLLFGEEVYLRKQYRDKLIQAFSNPGDSMNVTYFYGKSVNPRELIDLSETLPFFAERRLILVEKSEFFKNSCEELAQYLGEVAATTCFIFVEDEIDKRSKLYKAAAKAGSVIEFLPQTEETLYRWVRGKLRGVHKAITPGVFHLLVDKCGGDMETLEKEVEKLICYAWEREEITAADIEEICITQITDKIFEMVRSIGEKKQKRALNLYYDLLALKNTPFQILYMINRQFNILLQMKELAAAGTPGNIIAEKMGMRDFAVRQNLAQTRQFSKEELLQELKDGIQTEEDAKSGRMDAQLGVELLIVKYSSTEG